MMSVMDVVRTGAGGSRGSPWSMCFLLRSRLLLQITLTINWFSRGIALEVPWPSWVVRLCAMRDIQLTWYVQAIQLNVLMQC